MGDLRLVPPIPPAWAERPADAQADYMSAVVDAITNHPRSLQTRIGPSEIGTPCTRKLGYKLAGKPEREQRPNWRATVGTGCHLWQEETFDRANLVHAEATGNHGVERWLIEETVTIGVDANGQPITGHCDLYDRLTATVIDHKFVGPTQLKKYRSNGPGDQYRIQAHSYGTGWIAAGFPVEHVAISFLPRDGELADAYWWSEPYNPQIAANALQRLQGVQITLSALGDNAWAAFGTADDYCSGCPFFKAKSTDLATGCPGHPTSRAASDGVNQLDGLLAV